MEILVGLPFVLFCQSGGMGQCMYAEVLVPGIVSWPPTPSPNLVLSCLVPLQPCLFPTPLSNYCCLRLLRALGCGCGAWGTPCLGDIWQDRLARATAHQQVLSLPTASFPPPFGRMICPRAEVTVTCGLWIPMAALQEREIGCLALGAEGWGQ